MDMDMTTILMRTVFTYFFLLFILRLMGKRELGKLSVFDVVISIMLAEMAVLAIDQEDKPGLKFYVPMLLITFLEIGMSYLSMKSKKARDIVDGSADLIIENGEIREEAMLRNRLNMDDLMVHLRQKNIKSIADVEFAILETTGQMSVFAKHAKEPPTREDLHIPQPKPKYAVTFNGLPIPLILDGKIRDGALSKIGQNKFWLKQQIRKRGIRDIQDISFMSIDGQGNLFIDKKDKPRRP